MSSAALAFALCAGLIAVALPFAGRLSMAVPNARSSHALPTPQAGGVFVLLASAIALVATTGVPLSGFSGLAGLAVCTLALAIVGWIDDRRGLSAGLRLVAYAIVIVSYLAMAPQSYPTATGAPWIDLAVAGFCLLAFVNVTNFMDGIDGMIVVEFTPMLLTLAILAALGAFETEAALVAAPLFGALLGFFVFNRPKARIFLGDAGSVPVGFLVGVLLLECAKSYGIFAAVIPPLYFLVDASITLAQRILRGERFWHAHREHLYQRAFDAGQSNWSIIGRIFVCNIVLCGLAIFAGRSDMATGAALAALGIIAVGALSLTLLQRRRSLA